MGKTKAEKSATVTEAVKPLKSAKSVKPTKPGKTAPKVVDAGVARQEIDDLFSTAKKAKVESKSEEDVQTTKPLKIKKLRKEESLPYGIMKSENGNVIVNPEAPLERIDPESGLPVYKAHLLKVGEGGGTPLCPFDYNCCF